MALAFSGGVDSSLLARAAQLAGVRPLLALTFITELTPAADGDSAARVAAELGLEQRIEQMPVLELAPVADNAPDRCYHCKLRLLRRLQELAQELGLGLTADGSNADDLGVYRPGLRAAAELGVAHPLAAVGLTKADIRALSRELGLSVAERPSSPCLASRFPYHTRLTGHKLAQVAAGEDFLRGLGFAALRLRCHDDLARIEVEPEQLPLLLAQRQPVVAGLRQLGFRHVSLDLAGLTSGSFD